MRRTCEMVCVGRWMGGMCEQHRGHMQRDSLGINTEEELTPDKLDHLFIFLFLK